MHEDSYYSYQRSSVATEIRRANWDGSNDELVYSSIVYEHAEYGQYISGLALDLFNNYIFATTYHGNSQLRSVLRLPLNISIPATACL